MTGAANWLAGHVVSAAHGAMKNTRYRLRFSPQISLAVGRWRLLYCSHSPVKPAAWLRLPDDGVLKFC
jgi:hypothetical protein